MAQEKILGNQLNIPDVASDVAADPSAVASLESSIDHVNIVNGGGTNSHADIDAHIAQGSPAIHNTFTDIVQDTTPQLGGHLDLNGYWIITAVETTNTPSNFIFIAPGDNKYAGGGQTAGSIFAYAGSGYTGNSSGNVFIHGGINYGALDGGFVEAHGGYADAGGAGGDIDIAGGNAATGAGGIVYIAGGRAFGAAAGGDLDFDGGRSALGAAGHSIIRGGRADTSGQQAGSVKLYGGAGGAGHLPGTVETHAVSTNIHTKVSAIGQAGIRLWDDTNSPHTTGNYVELKAPAFAGSPLTDITFVLPELDGADGDVMLTDGAGNLSFGPWVLPKYTVGTLPLVVEGGQIYVTDATAASAGVGAQCFGRGVGSPALTEWVDVTTGLAVV